MVCGEIRKSEKADHLELKKHKYVRSRCVYAWFVGRAKEMIFQL